MDPTKIPQNLNNDDNQAVKFGSRAGGVNLSPIDQTLQTATVATPTITPESRQQPQIETTQIQNQQNNVTATNLASSQQFTQPANTMVVKPKKSPLILIFKILIYLLILAGVGFGAWQFYFKDLVMQKYTYNQYSISLPSSYEFIKPEVEYDGSEYVKKSGDGSNENLNTKVQVLVSDYKNGKTRKDNEKLYDDVYKEANKKDLIQYFGGNGMSAVPFESPNISISVSKGSDVSIYRATGKYTVGNLSGWFGGAMILKDDKSAYIYIANGKKDDISVEINKIFDSFKFESNTNSTTKP